jgi:hypothetical protein
LSKLVNHAFSRLSVMSLYVCKTAEQRAARKAYQALITNPSEADRLYDLVSGTDGGRIVSTDLARFLDPLYARTPPRGKRRDLAPSWDDAWKYAQGRFERELRTRSKRQQVAFMSGGWGAGKTHTLEKVPPNKRGFDLAWDGTLADAPWAKRMIMLALRNQWKVRVLHVHRNAELALYGAIEREAKEGRGVPLKDLPGNHRKVQQSMLNLIRRFHSTQEVDFDLFHNTGTSSVKGRALRILPIDLAVHGALHYNRNYEHYYSQAAQQIHETP